MGWCERFSFHKYAHNIIFDSGTKEWLIDIGSDKIMIKYCPFCGATMTNEDI